MKTNELTGAALDWAVAKCEGIDHDTAILNIKYGDDNDWFLAFSTDWAQGGPIIERERISVRDFGGDEWIADDSLREPQHSISPLVAAMRCYVASKLGDEITIPEELK